MHFKPTSVVYHQHKINNQIIATSEIGSQDLVTTIGETTKNHYFLKSIEEIAKRRLFLNG